MHTGSDRAEVHLRSILEDAIEFTDASAALVVYDRQSELAAALTEAYRRCLPRAQFIDFDAVSPEKILEAFKNLAPSDLAVLIQSTNFRLDAFRVRVELFNRGLKVIEHVHLGGMTGLEAEYYIDSLAYNPAYYRGVGGGLKMRLDRAREGVVVSGAGRLVFSGGFEAAKLNVGDYSQMKNVGGQFPIGEIFTEARNLESVNGRVRIFAFGDAAFKVHRPENPVTLTVERGRVAEAADSVPAFEEVLAAIRADEGEVWVRELGFGLNRAFSQERIVSDIGTFERMCGVHLSLGAKHSLYKKPHFTRRQARHHVDIFVETDSVLLDGEPVYQNGAWRV